MTIQYPTGMPTISAFLSELAVRTRPDRAAAWDPVGLQFGDPDAGIARVAVCHEVGEGMIDRLLEAGPSLVVTYHPLLFRPTNRLVRGRSASGRAWRLIDAGIALATTHTDFDASPGGTADALAVALALEDTRPFGPVEPSGQVKVVTFVPAAEVERLVEAMAAAGAGVIGNYDHCSFRMEGQGSFHARPGAAPVVGESGANLEPETRIEMVAPRSREAAVVAALVAAHPYEEPAFDVYDVRSNLGLVGRVGRWDGDLADLVQLVGRRLGETGLRVAGDAAAAVSRVAVVPGSGGSFVGAASAAGADVLITGDVDHHRAMAARESGMGVIDPGHAATERPGMGALVRLVESLGVEVVDLTDTAGPWVAIPALP